MNPLAIPGLRIVADLYVARTKYGKIFECLRGEFVELSSASADERAAWRRNRLLLVLKQAASAPFYAESGVDVSDLETFPYVRKQEYRSAPERFEAEAYRGRTTHVATSGTTGVGLRVRTTPVHVSALAASWWAFRARFGVGAGEKGIVFGGRRLDGWPFGRRLWVELPFTRQTLASSYDISLETLPKYAQDRKSVV